MRSRPEGMGVRERSEVRRVPAANRRPGPLGPVSFPNEKEFEMTVSTRWLAVAVGVFLSGWAVAAQPAPAPIPTTITAPDMDCASCAKKVGGKVAEVKGVGKVEYNVQARTITVTPKAGETLSPKAMWEAVVAGGQEPSKLAGPAGTFTTKPKQ